MDGGEFLRMLERFPVVRKRTHARVEWNSIYDNDEVVNASKARVALAGAGLQPSGISEDDSLQAALAKFLQVYFQPSEAHHIQREFEKAQLDFLSGLSLEDVNDLCAQFVDTK